MSLIKKMFGTYSDRAIKKISRIVDEIEDLAPRFSKMSSAELRAMTDTFKERLANGETLDDILPEAFAVVREAGDRVLGTRHYRVQLIGGVVLHQGRIAEMKTGEGKTLMATLPAYLNALAGKGVHIVTVNEYLAKRDAEWMGKIYDFLGLSVGLILRDMTKEEKTRAYLADITYATNNELGFDYLRDNMVLYKEDMVQRGQAFAIVDEVDSILIDEARTPLIISGEGEASSELYSRTDDLVRTMKLHKIKETDDKVLYEDLDADYIVDEKAKSATLTKNGIAKAERFFSVENLSDPENSILYHHINQAIRARGIMHRDEDYVIKDGQVIIVDSFTGRMMPGRRYSEGLHQAIEAKEGVDIQKESKTLATITFQNYFRLYGKLSGMTGTALTEEAEFRKIYNLDVVEIPTNRPLARVDHPDVVYKTAAAKYRAIVEKIRECYEKGQPVLVGTVSIDRSEYLSGLLKKAKIPHNVLNAKQHMLEAQIIAQAGTPGAVTISTNMAGRGTDIKLGGNPEFMAKQQLEKEGFEDALIAVADSFFDTEDEEIRNVRGRYQELLNEFSAKLAPEAEKARKAGGLYLLGTERHESRRIDNQLRGRSGRQGDPGDSTFYLSLEDDLLRLFGSERVIGLADRLGMDENQALEVKLLSKSIEDAQKRLEGENFGRREHVLLYDDVMNQQRQLIYKQRLEVLEGLDLKEKIRGMINNFVSEAVAELAPSDGEEYPYEELKQKFMGLLCSPKDLVFGSEDEKPDVAELTEMFLDRADRLYRAKEMICGEELFREQERSQLLMNVDRLWMEHLDAMNELKGSVGLNAYAQRNPIVEFKIQGSVMFDEMVHEIHNATALAVLSLPVRPNEEIRRKAVAKITGTNSGGDDTLKKKPVVKKVEAGPNDPCPCGSGKKYKKCCALKETN
ncbi:MAG: preprotein translocase subunit SecA [Clostridia bacterium]|nr:preprotein translocase subunit SecA [Clostridia bacterium]